MTRYRLTRRILLGGLALVYLDAFVSLWVQLDGLMGSSGILPAANLIARARESFGGAWWRMPTLFWWGASDVALHALCAAGVVLSLVAVCGLAPRAVFLGLWICYLSFVSVGDVFLGYQWDALLLETGFLAIFFAPGGLRPRWLAGAGPSPAILLLVRWLLFRLMFLSGAVKLVSGDTVWANFSALEYHYWTQPLPHRLSWYAHHLPDVFHRCSVGVMFAIELGAPFLIFAPRRLRLAAAGACALLMLLIVATGNYGFFNCLGLVLCVSLLDDQFVTRLLPGRFRPRVAALPTPQIARVRNACAFTFAAVIFLFTASTSALRLHIIDDLPAPVRTVRSYTGAFASFNTYGLFAVMTVQRPEILVEGSADGVEWRPYDFRWKPGDPVRVPGFTAGHMPRLDWQMWFAALGDPRRAGWYFAFAKRLLEGEAEVLDLLQSNPFPDTPPRYLRSTLWSYEFSSSHDRRESGAFWTREREGPWCGTLELVDGELRAATVR